MLNIWVKPKILSYQRVNFPWIRNYDGLRRTIRPE
jgi:hypothetical protein